MMEYTKLPKGEKKKLILAEMAIGGQANELAEKYDVNPMTISSWKRAERKRLEAETVEQARTADPVVLDAVVLELKTKASESDMPPVEIEKIVKKLDVVVEGVNGLQLLEGELHKTMMKLLGVANSKITDDMKMTDWSMLVTKIGEMHKILFATDSVTNFNMMQQNNGGSSAKVEKFKSGFRN